MKRTTDIRTLLLVLGTVWLALSAGVALADDDDADPAESTIRLMDAAEAELPEAVTKEIKLPPAALENSAAVENAERGTQTANENRERRENGLARADEARERGAEMADEAHNNRENRGRIKEPPAPPDPPRGPPGN